ncbi:MerR family transcriptional regulator [Polynucleobacter antarcticus]|uniref:HTH merR-type domain-containing protein n=1 Tax=Polynucleobacter antarcticus TaxID=1743162 RepID=A0A6M9PS24_9BURK|nr:MerR family transcriptional regulator [Polynucleobacter antarcticus]QKM62672.1 hypothetical protein DCO16_06140 [Polynucleobacter antarcticus]
MGFFINQYQGFSGNAVEMALLASQCAQNLQMPGDLDKINERLVRYYVAEGLVEKPKRIGRDAQYGYLHLLQLLGGRFLVDAGFPMQKVAPYLASLNEAQLEALVMNKTKPNMAELLVASFRNEPIERAHTKKEASLPQIPWSIPTPSIRTSNAMKDGLVDVLSADLNAFASRVQGSIEPPNTDHLNQLNDQLINLSESIKNGMQEMLERSMVTSEKERAVLRENFKRLELIVRDQQAQWQDLMERERHERREQFFELQDKLNQLIAMTAQNKGKEHD